jgi:putative peptidoglycan lipid II flippase
VFGVPGFSWDDTKLTGRILAIIALSITAQAICQLLIRAFYALKNTKTPLKISLVTSSIFIFISWLSVFVLKVGLEGIAVGVSLSTILEMLLFLYCLDRRVKGFMGKAFWVPQMKMITASFFMAVFLYLPFRILDELVFNTSHTVELILLTITTATIGMLVYIYFAMLFEIRELTILKDILDKLDGWKKTLSRTEEVLLETGMSGDEL